MSLVVRVGSYPLLKVKYEKWPKWSPHLTVTVRQRVPTSCKCQAERVTWTVLFNLHKIPRRQNTVDLFLKEKQAEGSLRSLPVA